jgi:hypothetical protein
MLNDMILKFRQKEKTNENLIKIAVSILIKLESLSNDLFKPYSQIFQN